MTKQRVANSVPSIGIQAGSPSNKVWLMTAALVSFDLIALSVAVVGGFFVWSKINPAIPALQPQMLLGVGFCVAAFAFYDLYPGLGKGPVEQMRDMCRAITLSFLLLLVAMFFEKGFWANSRGGVLLAWILSLLLIPLGRGYLRARKWWGVPILVLGAGETARLVIRNLKTSTSLGYRPFACLDDREFPGNCDGIPVVGDLSMAASVASEHRINYAIVAMPGMSKTGLANQMQIWSQVFSHLIVVPDLIGIPSLWVDARDLGGVLGFEIQHNLLNPMNRSLKRLSDIVLSVLGLLLSAVPIAIVAVWIRIVSPVGGVFYTQQREGKNGKPLRVVKLRTMYHNADQLLQDLLVKDPIAAKEWGKQCKLTNDPRILPGVGTFLRKSSLDELPQLWNVLKGEMSLVGPRPFPRYHNERFHQGFQTFRLQVSPGLTGLWQISSRSDTDLLIQQSLDSYYIRNWSVWLDLYILLGTVRTVLAREGS